MSHRTKNVRTIITVTIGIPAAHRSGERRQWKARRCRPLSSLIIKAYSRLVTRNERHRRKLAPLASSPAPTLPYSYLVAEYRQTSRTRTENPPCRAQLGLRQVHRSNRGAVHRRRTMVGWKRIVGTIGKIGKLASHLRANANDHGTASYMLTLHPVRRALLVEDDRSGGRPCWQFCRSAFISGYFILFQRYKQAVISG